MQKRPKTLVLVASLGALLGGLTPASGWTFPGQESWYMNRGESNLKIGNYKAAIEAFEKVCDEDPDNRQAMKSLAVAYEKQGLKDKSIEQYDRYLERNPDDADAAFHQAETLGWSRYSYRRRDSLKYYQQGLEHKNDPRMRLKYARLLASNRDTNSEAIHEYETVLKSNPDSGEAHKGLAKAYAWEGRRDLALYHAEKAESLGVSRSELSKVERDMSDRGPRGPGPTVGGDFNLISQPGADYGLGGFQLTSLGHVGLGSSVTLSAQAGMEDYWHDTSSAAGALVTAGLEYRHDAIHRFRGKLGYHSLSPLTAATPAGRKATPAPGGSGTVTGLVEYTYQGDGYSISPGFERAIKYDSFLSIVGSKTIGTGLGQARSNLFYTDMKFKPGSFDVGVRPYLGFVTALTVSPNEVLGADTSVEHALIGEEGGDFALAGRNTVQLAHYGKDQSAFSGQGAGYFSPQLFLNESPSLVAKVGFGDGKSLSLGAGPAFQYVRDNSLPGGWQVGADARLSYAARFNDSLAWNLGAGYDQVADAYNRFEIDNMLTYTF